ncbi:YtxH domain-containing protein [Cellulomonas sp. URHB0016]
MKGKVAFAVGAGVGYVLGARAGRGQFERIKSWANDAWHDPRVQDYVQEAESQATQFAKQQGAALKDKAVEVAKSAVSGRTGDSKWTSSPEADDPVVDVRAGEPVLDVDDLEHGRP